MKLKISYGFDGVYETDYTEDFNSIEEAEEYYNKYYDWIFEIVDIDD